MVITLEILGGTAGDTAAYPQGHIRKKDRKYNQTIFDFL